MTSSSDALRLGTMPAAQIKIPFGIDIGAAPPSPSPEQPVFHQPGQGPLFIFGKTGAGKSSMLIDFCAAAPADTGIVAVDIKGELATVTAAHRRALGAKVHIIDPWHAVTETPDSLNPLDLIDPASLSAADDAATLAEAIVAETSHHDRYWDTATRHAIAAGSLLLAAHAPPEARHLSALADMLGSGAGPTLAAFLAAGLCSDAGEGIVRRECENLASLAQQTLASVSGTLSSHLRPLSSPLIKAALSHSTIDLEAFGRGEPMTIYLVIGPERLKSHRRCIRLWINTLVTMIARRRRHPTTRTLFLVDEMPALGPLEAIRSLSYFLRSFGADMVGCAQAADQLARQYPIDWQALLDNAGGVLALSGGAAMRRLAQATCGDEIARNVPDLPTGQAALFRNGEVAFIRKQDYRENPDIAHLAQLNRFHHSPAEINHVR